MGFCVRSTFKQGLKAQFAGGLLARLVDEYEVRQAVISLPTLEQVADEYLDVLGLDEFVGARADAG